MNVWHVQEALALTPPDPAPPKTEQTPPASESPSPPSSTLGDEQSDEETEQLTRLLQVQTVGELGVG